MKKLLLLFLPLLCFGAEYEFLTPQVVVIKDFKGAINVKNAGVWNKENGLLRDAKNNILKKADISKYVYFTLPKPLKNGEKTTFGTYLLQYDAEKPTQIFKLNQLGNGEKQRQKYAYMGVWLGSAGALPLKHLDGRTFEIRRSSDSKTVFVNKIKMRRSDPFYQGKIPFTGEEVAELDYSKFNTPGKYYFYVENIGKSMDFTIGAETLSEAFYIHARGLYHKRCGIAKEQPFTAWTSPACHSQVYTGSFPGNDEHYRKGKNIEEGFVRKFQRVEVKHFELIKRHSLSAVKSVSAPGGWHDAADYDRRPYHLRIVNDLATVYLMKPENFIDGQLNIPESDNGIPDILDEAVWGLKHLLAVQQQNGGVGTWFETTGHPQAGEGLPDKDKYVYYVSAPSRNSTFDTMAIGALRAIRDHGLKVPEDISVVGFDGIELGNYLTPKLFALIKRAR